MQDVVSLNSRNNFVQQIYTYIRMYTFVTCENPSILFDYEDDQRDSPPAREVRRSGRVPLKVANGTYCSSSNSRKASIKLVKVGHFRYLFLFAISDLTIQYFSLFLFLSLNPFSPFIYTFIYICDLYCDSSRSINL